MATVISGSPTQIDIIFNWNDEADESARQVVSIDDAADADIIQYVDDTVALSNALAESIQVVYKFDITGYATAGKPAAAVQSLLAAILAMQFDKANPLNGSKTVSKQVALPAYINALRNDSVQPHIPVTTNANLNSLVAFLEDHLMYVAADGSLNAGGWAFNLNSKFGTKPTVTDGFQTKP